VLLKPLETLQVFEDNLILHCGVEDYETTRGGSEVDATLIVLILAEHQLDLFAVVQTLKQQN
jgi:hypothetical protein